MVESARGINQTDVTGDEGTLEKGTIRNNASYSGQSEKVNDLAQKEMAEEIATRDDKLSYWSNPNVDEIPSSKETAQTIIEKDHEKIIAAQNEVSETTQEHAGVQQVVGQASGKDASESVAATVDDLKNPFLGSKEKFSEDQIEKAVEGNSEGTVPVNAEQANTDLPTNQSVLNGFLPPELQEGLEKNKPETAQPGDESVGETAETAVEVNAGNSEQSAAADTPREEQVAEAAQPEQEGEYAKAPTLDSQSETEPQPEMETTEISEPEMETAEISEPETGAERVEVHEEASLNERESSQDASPESNGPAETEQVGSDQLSDQLNTGERDAEVLSGHGNEVAEQRPPTDISHEDPEVQKASSEHNNELLINPKSPSAVEDTRQRSGERNV